MAQHAVEYHLNAKTKYDDDWDSHCSKHWVVVSWCQQTHGMNPDHEARCPPVVVVASCVLGLSVHIAEGYPPRSAVRSLQGKWMIREATSLPVEPAVL